MLFRNLQKWHKKICVRVAVWGYSFIKKDTMTHCFPINFAKFLRTPNTIWLLLLAIEVWPSKYRNHPSVNIIRDNPANISMLWINVEITLIRRWKWNKIRRRIFKIAQRWYNVGARRWNNVAKRWYNVDTTLFPPSVDIS